MQSNTMDDRKHSSSSYRPGTGGIPINDSRGGGGGTGHRSLGGGRNSARGDRRLKERDGRDQRMRSGRGRVRSRSVYVHFYQLPR